MATSGSVDYNRTAEQVIRDALELLQVISPYETLEGNDYSTCLVTLNLMIKAWQAQGLHLWTEQEGVLFLNDDQLSYNLGGTSPDKASDNIYKTEISTAEASGQTVLSVDSTTSMSVSDQIGVVLDSGAIHWSTVSSKTATTVTIASATTGAAAVGNNVYTYTTALGRPLHISSVRLLSDDDIETELMSLSRMQYFRIPNKTTSGTPTQYFLDKQRTVTKMYIYPVSDNAERRIRFTYKRIMEDIDSSTNDFDFPQEWLACLTYNLAVWVAPKYNLEEKVSAGGTSIAAIATQNLQLLKQWDQEHVSLYVRPSGPRDYY